MLSAIKDLGLLVKRAPQKKEENEIKIAQEKEGVKINVSIEEELDKDLNREEILKVIGLLPLALERGEVVKDDDIDEKSEKIKRDDLLKSKLSVINEGDEDMSEDEEFMEKQDDEEEEEMGADETKGPKKQEKGVQKRSSDNKKSRMRDSMKSALNKTVTRANKQSDEEIKRLEAKFKKEEVEHVVNPFYMTNRKKFVNFMNKLNEKHKDALEEEAKSISCDRGTGPFKLMTHQMVVKDYINLYTPYRGLLIYHGLGAGKTCSSIAIAEGMKTSNQVVVMTPASLRDNYIAELKTCGDILYKLNNHWEFKETNGDKDKEEELAYLLNIPVNIIKKTGGAWFVNLKKEQNYDKLTRDEQISLNNQIDYMISTKYRFINYNGMRMKSFDDLKEADSDNFFNNKVVIIDEAHNFVSRVVNKISKKKSLSYKLYEKLMDADNCKIVFLTGTPIINYPNEIGVLFNMLRGYIKTFNFTLETKTKEKIDENFIKKLFNSTMKSHDYINYNPSSKVLQITRNPFGFVSIFKGDKYKGVEYRKKKDRCEAPGRRDSCEKGYICDKNNTCSFMTDAYFAKKCKKILEDKEIDVKTVSIKKDLPLPDINEEFIEYFIDDNTKEIQNIGLFQKRILGLTSYFRSAQEQLMPRYDVEKDFYVELIEMSDYQFGIYENARNGERDMEKKNAKKSKSKIGAMGEETVSTYRIFSRAFCNFVFPRDVERPKPIKDQELTEAIKNSGINEDDLDGISVDEKIENIDGSYTEEDVKDLKELEKEISDRSYSDRIEEALRFLKLGAREYLTPKALETYSPKFLKVLENLQSEDKPGLHLIYSQFRTLEGIGILSLILDANGFARFKIKKNKVSNIWELDIDEEDIGKPMYALYTGKEEKEEKEHIRNIYNGLWDKVPASLVDPISKIAQNNNMGEIIKVLMITSSGAEGINLKNTRYVHIIEPYWHPVRIEQVVGRARRICSHNKLPKELQTVDVYLYLMTLTEAQKTSKDSGGLASQDLLVKDVSKKDKKTPFTSDETLWEISTIKQDINKQILTAIKSTSIDCKLHKEGSDEPYVCLSYGDPNPDEFTSAPALKDSSKDVEEKFNIRKKKTKVENITYKGTKYAIVRNNTSVKLREAAKIEGALEGKLYLWKEYEKTKKIQNTTPYGTFKYNKKKKTYSIVQ